MPTPNYIYLPTYTDTVLYIQFWLYCLCSCVRTIGCILLEYTKWVDLRYYHQVFSTIIITVLVISYQYIYSDHPTELVPVSLSLNGTHMYAKISLEKVFPKPQCNGNANVSIMYIWVSVNFKLNASLSDFMCFFTLRYLV